jgi:ribosomal protein S27E
MRVGRSEAVRCDVCGDMIVGSPDLVRIGDKERHFCGESTCMEEFFIERCRPALTKEAERLARIEREFLYKLICPSCRHRFITKANAGVDQLKLVCPLCKEEIDHVVLQGPWGVLLQGPWGQK